MTHTFAELVVGEGTYAEIASKLRDAGYDHAFLEEGAIDMQGIGVTKSKACQPRPSGDARIPSVANHADECRSDGLDWWCVSHCATRQLGEAKARIAKLERSLEYEEKKARQHKDELVEMHEERRDEQR